MALAARSRQRSSETGYDVEALRRDLHRGVLEPVYGVLGSEMLLAEEAVDVLVEAAVPSESRDFNLDQYSGDDDTARQFLSQARSFPFMAERRVVVVRRFEKMLAALKDRAEAALLEYLAQPAPSTVLVLVASKLDRRYKIPRAIEKSARVVSVDQLPEPALPGWVQARFEAHGLGADDQACNCLVQLVGTALLDLRNEVDKVAVRYAGAGHVGEAEVRATVGRYREEEVWAINRAFRPDNMGGFLEALSRVLDVDDQPIRITAVLARQVNNLLRVKLLQDRGVRGSGEMARRMGLPPFVIQDLARQAQGFTRRQLVLWLRNLQRADVQMKSVRLPQRWVLERALVNSFLGQELV
ncbi:MAG: DNA polymerase III subunit delta [Candidatus Krumholzibacteriia bacterium]